MTSKDSGTCAVYTCKENMAGIFIQKEKHTPVNAS